MGNRFVNKSVAFIDLKERCCFYRNLSVGLNHSQLILLHTNLPPKLILILSSHLRLGPRSCFFAWGLEVKNCVWYYHVPIRAVCPAYHIMKSVIFCRLYLSSVDNISFSLLNFILGMYTVGCENYSNVEWLTNYIYIRNFGKKKLFGLLFYLC